MSPDAQPGSTRAHEPSPRLVARLADRLDMWRDPGVQAFVVLAALAVAGFVMLGLAWRGDARTPYVPLQMPWLVSGGVTGLALLGLALGAWSIHLGRRADAAHRAAVDEVVRDAIELAERVRTGRVRRPGSRSGE